MPVASNHVTRLKERCLFKGISGERICAYLLDAMACNFLLYVKLKKKTNFVRRHEERVGMAMRSAFPSPSE